MSRPSPSALTLPSSNGAHSAADPPSAAAAPSDGRLTQPIPRHVAVIMDGNGRWAAQRGLRPTDGHRAGTENIRAAIEAFGERGVRCLTLFAFSTENWKRPRPEVRGLMRILSSTKSRVASASATRWHWFAEGGTESPAWPLGRVFPATPNHWSIT